MSKIISIINQPNITDPVNTVCDLKWNYPIFNFGRNEYRTCCRSPANLVADSELDELGVNAFTNHPREIQQRLDLIKGKKIDHCSHCWKLEDNNMKSPREPRRFHYWMMGRGFIDENLEYDKNKVEDSLTKINSIDHPSLLSTAPDMVEISLGNTCDMKCMYCSHHYSSQWASERIKYGEIKESDYLREFPKSSDKFKDTFWLWFKSVRLHIRTLGIIGGEPLITPEFYPLIQQLTESVREISEFRKKKITLFFVTNMNTNDKYFDKFIEALPALTETFNVEILISQESVGKKSEYIRNGLDWNTFDKNVNKLLSFSELKFDVSFLPTMNILSVSSIADFVNYLIDLQGKYTRPIAIRQNVISDPHWQSPNLLTPDFSKYINSAIDIIESNYDLLSVVDNRYGKWDEFVFFLERLSSGIENNEKNNEHRKKFAEWFDTYDVRRRTNLVETFPEYREFYEMCKGL
jgi:hypothetical protein